MKHATLRRHGDALDAAERWGAEEAAKPELTNEARACSLFHAMKAALEDGRTEDAKAHALALRPLLGFLPA